MKYVIAMACLGTAVIIAATFSPIDIVSRMVALFAGVIINLIALTTFLILKKIDKLIAALPREPAAPQNQSNSAGS